MIEIVAFVDSERRLAFVFLIALVRSCAFIDSESSCSFLLGAEKYPIEVNWTRLAPPGWDLSLQDEVLS